MIRLKRILFPTDFSECSRSAQEYACNLAEQYKAELHLLHVLQDVTPYVGSGGAMISVPDTYYVEQKHAAEDALSRLLPTEWMAGKQVLYATRLGNPWVEIINYAKELEIDLIVIGTHGRSALMHVLLGSVAERVVRTAPCPVLTVHPAGHQFVGS